MRTASQWTFALFFCSIISCIFAQQPNEGPIDYKCGAITAPDMFKFKTANTDATGTQVMGGFPVQFFNFPSIVGIHININGFTNYLCSGSLISNDTVITAAHCFQNFSDISYLTKLCGKNMICRKEYIGLSIEKIEEKTNKERCSGGFFTPESIKKHILISAGTTLMSEARTLPYQYKVVDVHPFYRKFFERGCFQHDIALLKVEAIYRTVQHSCVLSRTAGMLSKMENTVAIGWGSDPVKKIHIHKELQGLNTGPVLNQTYCNTLMNGSLVVDGICVVEYKDRNTCSGDSGSPLLYRGNETNNRQVVLGVLSHGTKCTSLLNNTIPKAAVYTRLDYYVTIINDYIGAPGLYDDLQFTPDIINAKLM